LEALASPFIPLYWRLNFLSFQPLINECEKGGGNVGNGEGPVFSFFPTKGMGNTERK
jgi:hypothetical protein